MKNGMRDEANLSRQHAFVRKAILAHFYIQTTSPFCSTAKTHIAGETILYAKLHVEQTRPKASDHSILFLLCNQQAVFAASCFLPAFNIRGGNLDCLI